jgi:hypothetical protein
MGRRWGRIMAMRFQFGTAAIFIAIAFIAITLAGGLAVFSAYQPANWTIVAIAFFVVQSPFWVPMVFLAYAAGRRTMSVRILIAFAIAEGIAVALNLIFCTKRNIYAKPTLQCTDVHLINLSTSTVFHRFSSV